MEPAGLKIVKGILDDYLVRTKGRKTTERYAILDACYESKDVFNIQELNDRLEKNSFYVSRTTLYNTIRLFISLRIIFKHNIAGETKYEPAYITNSHIKQICTICGKVNEVSMQTLSKTILQQKLRRFKQYNFALFIYGTCSTCQTKLKRKNKKE